MSVGKCRHQQILLLNFNILAEKLPQNTKYLKLSINAKMQEKAVSENSTNIW